MITCWKEIFVTHIANNGIIGKKKKKLLQSNKDENYPREDGQIYQEKMHKGT